MANSTAAALTSKPRPDFPLYPHQSDRWAKKVRGKTRFFGKASSDPKGEAALAEWLRQKDYLLAGRTPPNKDDDAPVLADLVNHFLTWKQSLVESGELASRTWDRYDATCGLLVKHFGRGRRLDDLTPDDFLRLRADMSKRWGPVALGNEIQIVRSVFRYGHESELLDKPVRFGPGFKKPSAKTLRLERAKAGPRLFTADQIQDVLKVAGINTRAMILLGINGGLGNTDLGKLPLSAIDLKSGWLDYSRPKTGVPRRIPLWPETVAAIKKVLAKRCEPKNDADKGLLFVGARGKTYGGGNSGRLISKAFARSMAKAGFAGRAFYDLRRTFQTIAEGACDLTAVQSIMGHAPSSSDMSAIYRQRIDDKRLLAVTEHVRNWLYAKPTKRAKGKGVAHA